jgi:carboxymethylenebutenolidase
MTDSSLLPSAKPISCGPHIIIQPPLTRYGRGPGLFIIRPATFADCQGQNQSLDPEPLQKWAEEGFAVAQITLDAQNSNTEAIACLGSQARQQLSDLPECTSDKSLGLIGGL